MDWRQTGELIRERGRQRLSDCANREWASSALYSNYVKELGRRPKYLLDVPSEELANLYKDGDDQLDFAILGVFSHQELRPFLVEFDRPKPGNGRPRCETSRVAATLAFYFYDAWRRENRRCGISDYVYRREMKDIAARAVVEDLFAWRFDVRVRSVYGGNLDRGIETFIPLVRDLMEKPKVRRSPWGDAFYVWPTGLELPPKPL